MNTNNPKIAFLGPEGSFSELAARRYFRADRLISDLLPKNNLTQVFESVAFGESGWGVVPSENLIDGTVGKTLDLLVRHNNNVRIVGEEILQVEHCLAVLYLPSRYSSIDGIISHPKALEQCSDYLAQHFPSTPLIEAASTAAAMRDVKNAGNSVIAAVGHVDAAKRNGLIVMDSAIQDNPNNFTTFYVISSDMEVRDGADKTTISVDIPAEGNDPGALYNMLYPFKDLGINLSRVESRPTGEQRGEYRFFLDMDGSLREERIRLAILWTMEMAGVKSLGSYKRASMDEKIPR